VGYVLKNSGKNFGKRSPLVISVVVFFTTTCFICLCQDNVVYLCMNLKEILEKYITILEVKDIDEVSTNNSHPLPGGIGSVVVRVDYPLFYINGESTFEVLIYIDPNFTRAECGYWFENLIRYLGVSDKDIGPWISSKFLENMSK
jgi:hypothetical protein